jgi:hypothetical protein
MALYPSHITHIFMVHIRTSDFPEREPTNTLHTYTHKASDPKNPNAMAKPLTTFVFVELIIDLLLYHHLAKRVKKRMIEPTF